MHNVCVFLTYLTYSDVVFDYLTLWCPFIPLTVLCVVEVILIGFCN